MRSIPLLDEREVTPLVTYSTSSEEEMCDAVVSAFSAANIDVTEEPTVLNDWINGDVLSDIHWSSDHPVSLITRVWDHWTVMTPEEIRIYDARTYE